MVYNIFIPLCLHSEVLKLSLKIFSLTVAIVLLYNSCKKKNNNDSVPLTTVDITINTSLPSYIALHTVGNYLYVTGGVRGLLVYRKTTTDFMAYDRNCTYQSSQPCATVIVDATHIIATDTCCHSKFSIYDGSVTQGPAVSPLKAYQTSFDGTYLHIFN